MEKLYQIQNGSVTLYLTHWKDKEFRLQGFTVDNENYYVESSLSEDSCLNGRKVIHIEEYLYRMYKAEADEQLQNYVARHINDYTFYSEYSEDGFTFWNKAMNSI